MPPVNVPNLLTVLRVLLVPGMVAALLTRSDAGDVVAAVIFLGAFLTDVLDGHLARSRGDVTDFGKVMDPIADKLLVVAALITLVALDRLAAWVAAVIVAREVLVTIARAQAGVVIPAAGWGKVKTGVQTAAIVALIALAPSPAWVDALVYAAVVVTVISGLDFFLALRRRGTAASATPAS